MGKAAAAVASVCAAASSAAAIVLVAKRLRDRSRWNRALSLVKEFEMESATPTSRLRNLVDAMTVEMHAGLASEGGSKLKMLLTFLSALPTGEENGVFYAVELKVPSLSLLQVAVKGEERRPLNIEADKIPIPHSLLCGTTEELFDFIASELEAFVEKTGSEFVHRSERRAEVCFSVPFPLKHQSISSGMLLTWAKDFEIEDIGGKDIGDCLQQAILSKGLNMRVAALVNDTVGTLAMTHYSDNDALAAVVFGLETNACYIEHANAITKFQLSDAGSMVINMEWGNFWSSHLPWTLYDEEILKAEDSNSAEQSFGRLISGIYLGEVLRRIILRMVQECSLLGGVVPDKLLQPFILKTIPHISSMDQDDSVDLKVVGDVMKDVLGITNAPMKLRRLVFEACNLVVERAGRLAAAGILGVLKKLGRDGSQGILGVRVKRNTPNRVKRTVVAIDGELYANIPRFRHSLHMAVVELLGEKVSRHIVFNFTNGGSAIGAALVAASNSIYS